MDWLLLIMIGLGLIWFILFVSVEWLGLFQNLKRFKWWDWVSAVGFVLIGLGLIGIMTLNIKGQLMFQEKIMSIPSDGDLKTIGQ